MNKTKFLISNEIELFNLNKRIKNKIFEFNLVYGFCPAVLMSLMYSVSSEISGSSNIKKNYTLNVMFSGFGIILGPVLSGN